MISTITEIRNVVAFGKTDKLPMYNLISDIGLESTRVAGSDPAGLHLTLTIEVVMYFRATTMSIIHYSHVVRYCQINFMKQRGTQNKDKTNRSRFNADKRGQEKAKRVQEGETMLGTLFFVVFNLDFKLPSFDWHYRDIIGFDDPSHSPFSSSGSHLPEKPVFRNTDLPVTIMLVRHVRCQRLGW